MTCLNWAALRPISSATLALTSAVFVSAPVSAPTRSSFTHPCLTTGPPSPRDRSTACLGWREMRHRSPRTSKVSDTEVRSLGWACWLRKSSIDRPVDSWS